MANRSSKAADLQLLLQSSDGLKQWSLQQKYTALLPKSSLLVAPAHKDIVTQRMHTWKSFNNGLCNKRVIADVGNDATPWPQPLPQLPPYLHLKRTKNRMCMDHPLQPGQSAKLDLPFCMCKHEVKYFRRSIFKGLCYTQAPAIQGVPCQ